MTTTTMPRLGVLLLAGAVGGVVGGAVVLTAQGYGAEEKVVRARAFEVVDADGRSRVTLGMLSPSIGTFEEWQRRARAHGVPGLVIADAEGTGRTTLAVWPQGPQLLMADSEGDTKLEVLVGDDGAPSVTLVDGNGSPRVWLETDGKGQPAMRLLGASGMMADLSVSDSESPEGVQLFMRAEHGASVRLRAEAGTEPALTLVGENGEKQRIAP